MWSADLYTFKENKGYKYLLNFIDIFFKYAYSIDLKSKSQEAIIAAFNKLFKFDNRKPDKLWTDTGTEFVIINTNIVLNHITVNYTIHLMEAKLLFLLSDLIEH